MPEGDSQTRGPMVGSQANTTATSNVGSAVQDTRTLAESFNLLSQYGDEFMDENPLVGEPGSFILSRSGDNAAMKQGLAPPTATGVPGRVGTPQVRVDTPGKVSDRGGDTPSAEDNRLRRRKSKIGS